MVAIHICSRLRSPALVSFACQIPDAERRVYEARHVGIAQFWLGVRGIVDRLPYLDGVDAALARDHTLESSPQQYGTTVPCCRRRGVIGAQGELPRMLVDWIVGSCFCGTWRNGGRAMEEIEARVKGWMDCSPPPPCSTVCSSHRLGTFILSFPHQLAKQRHRQIR